RPLRRAEEAEARGAAALPEEEGGGKGRDPEEDRGPVRQAAEEGRRGTRQGAEIEGRQGARRGDQGRHPRPGEVEGLRSREEVTDPGRLEVQAGGPFRGPPAPSISSGTSSGWRTGSRSAAWGCRPRLLKPTPSG